MFQTPIHGSRLKRLVAAATSFANSATLQALFGVSTANAALANIHIDIADDKEGVMPRPRLIVRHWNSMNAEREGSTTWNAKGAIAVFLQVDQLTDAQLIAKYSLTKPVTIEDHHADVTALMGQITDDVATLAAAQPAPGGCLEITHIEEVDCGLVDPEEENQDEFFDAVWCVRFDGQL